MNTVAAVAADRKTDDYDGKVSLTFLIKRESALPAWRNEKFILLRNSSLVEYYEDGGCCCSSLMAMGNKLSENN